MNVLLEDIVGLFLGDEEVFYPEYERQRIDTFRAKPRTPKFQDTEGSTEVSLFFPVSSVSYQLDSFRLFSSDTGELMATMNISMGEIVDMGPGDELAVNLPGITLQ